jgi:hypothetical protein
MLLAKQVEKWILQKLAFVAHGFLLVLSLFLKEITALYTPCMKRAAYTPHYYFL